MLPRYERVVFDKDLASVPGHALAEFVCPGHPLLDAVTDLVLEKYGSMLRLGSILVDRADASDQLRVLIYLEHTITGAGGGFPRCLTSTPIRRARRRRPRLGRRTRSLSRL